jgi:hypothetical protein
MVHSSLIEKKIIIIITYCSSALIQRSHQVCSHSMVSKQLLKPAPVSLGPLSKETWDPMKQGRKEEGMGGKVCAHTHMNN